MEDLRADEVAEWFALGRSPRWSDDPATRGKQGVVRRLDTADGRWAVKVPLTPATEDAVAGGAAFQERAVRAGVPAPLVRRTGDGAVLADLGGTRVRVSSWVDVLPADDHLDPAAVGELLSALHRVPDPSAAAEQPVHPWYSAPVGEPRWRGLAGELVREGAPFADRFATLVEELVALESWLVAPSATRTCHRDLWSDNLRAVPGGGLCVLDWDDAGPAGPAQELACVVFEFARTDPGRVRDLTAAYRDAGGPGRLTAPADFSLLVAQLGHVTEAAASAWLRSPGDADATAWVGEFLDEPHTRAVLRDLLAALDG